MRVRWEWGGGIAVMAQGPQRLDKVEGRTFFIGLLALPKVTTCASVIFSQGGGWVPHIMHLRGKAIRKTAELVSWVHQQGVALNILVRL